MKLVRIIRDYKLPDLMRQTPGNSGVWGGIRFTTDPVEECDYLIVLNIITEKITIRCPRQNIWALMQEPPIMGHKRHHRGVYRYQRIYTQDINLRNRRHIFSPPFYPWYIDRNYDELSNCRVPTKNRNLSWITSNLTICEGHRERVCFLERISGKVEFDLFGRGFTPLADKWDGLAPYRYSIAVENYRGPYYWTEKIADCFLSWTMPIYYGCTNITDYFPPEAMVLIDIDDIEEAVDKIREAIAQDLWRKNLDAIEYARKLVLDKYQLFPFLANEIREHEKDISGQIPTPETITMKRQRQWNESRMKMLRLEISGRIPKPIKQWLKKKIFKV